MPSYIESELLGHKRYALIIHNRQQLNEKHDNNKKENGLIKIRTMTRSFMTEREVNKQAKY